MDKAETFGFYGKKNRKSASTRTAKHYSCVLAMRHVCGCLIETDVCTVRVRARKTGFCFQLGIPEWVGGLGRGEGRGPNVYINERSAEIPKTALQQKSHQRRQYPVETLTDTTMMIKMIPHTSPMILNILAFLEASMAPFVSPTPLALCTFGRAQCEHYYTFCG